MAEKEFNLNYFFYPSSVAVIGASKNPNKIGGIIINNLVKSGYKGKIYPVNIKCGEEYNEIAGLKCYKTILDIPDTVDTAVIVVPARFVPDVVEDCGKKGIKSLIIISSGFAETGKEGKKLQDKVIEIAKKHGIRIIGPNTLGIVNTNHNLNLWFGMPIRLKGKISFISQSGAIADGLFGVAQDEGIGFNIVVSLGNRADVDEADLMLYLKDDSFTRVIGIYLEGLPPGAGRRFLEALKETSTVKPVVVLKGGRSIAGSRATLSHTASMAGSYEVYVSAIKQFDGIPVESMEEFLDTLKAFVYIDRYKSTQKRIAIITNSGGLGILAADAAESLGLSIPEFPRSVQEEIMKVIPPFGNPMNPVDITAQGTPEDQYKMYSEVFKIVNDPSLVDGIIVIVEGSYPYELMKAIKDALVKEIAPNRRLPVIVCWFGALSDIRDLVKDVEKSGLPVYMYPERAVKVMKNILY
ncbi:MAG: CoA-binding protein [Staphylothermus sp.]|nr:CoA-binding protein [Staphylothermus sp.]